MAPTAPTAVGGSKGTGEMVGGVYLAWEAGVDAVVDIFTRVVEVALRYRVFAVVEIEDDGIVYGGVELVWVVVQALLAILDTHLHLVDGGHGEWENGEGEKDGGMHDE